MREDECRIRSHAGAEILADFRQIAVTLPNSSKTFKAGLKGKQRKAVMSTCYPAAVLARHELS